MHFFSEINNTLYSLLCVASQMLFFYRIQKKKKNNIIYLRTSHTRVRLILK